MYKASSRSLGARTILQRLPTIEDKAALKQVDSPRQTTQALGKKRQAKIVANKLIPVRHT